MEHRLLQLSFVNNSCLEPHFFNSKQPYVSRAVYVLYALMVQQLNMRRANGKRASGIVVRQPVPVVVS